MTFFKNLLVISYSKMSGLLALSSLLVKAYLLLGNLYFSETQASTE